MLSAKSCTPEHSSLPPAPFDASWIDHPIENALNWQEAFPDGAARCQINKVIVTTRFRTARAVLENDKTFSARGQSLLSLMQRNAHLKTKDLTIGSPEEKKPVFLAHLDGQKPRDVRKHLLPPFNKDTARSIVDRCMPCVSDAVRSLEGMTRFDLAGWADDLAVRLIAALMGYSGDMMLLARWCRRRGLVPSMTAATNIDQQKNEVFRSDACCDLFFRRSKRGSRFQSSLILPGFMLR